MSREEDIVRHIKEISCYAPSLCPWHHRRSCLLLLHNADQRKFHCLYACSYPYWKAYGESESCDIPDYFHDMIALHRELGPEYVLRFDRHFRERSGYTVGLYEIEPGLFGSNVLKPENLAETFYALVVFLCAVCRRMGGHLEAFKHLSFLYTPRHPVLTDVGCVNGSKRERTRHLERTNEKKWHKTLTRKTTRDVLGYLKLIRPDFFKKKRPARSVCVLSADAVFDDRTHRLVCSRRRSSVAQVLEEFLDLMPDEGIRGLVGEWIEGARRPPEAQDGAVPMET